MSFQNVFPIPDVRDLKIDWETVEHAGASWISPMKKTEQNPVWHTEGDVWTHTRLVCETLVRMEEWQAATELQREILFLAALFHDVGKPTTTRLENGVPKSPRHGSVGAHVTRGILWRELDLNGTVEKWQFREAICGLVRFHTVPLHILDFEQSEIYLIRPSVYGITIPEFSNRMLTILTMADIQGRIADNIAESIEKVSFFPELAEECHCLDAPYPFTSDYNRFVYLTQRKQTPSLDLFDDQWDGVTLLSGLPATGKDTFITNHLTGMPVVSLDAIREEKKIATEDDQGIVIAEAKERARVFLRKKQPFIWNATNLNALTREPLIRLFTDYHARVQIVYLEAPRQEIFRRNQERNRHVPESVMETMLDRMEPPTHEEACSVTWIEAATQKEKS